MTNEYMREHRPGLLVTLQPCFNQNTYQMFPSDHAIQTAFTVHTKNISLSEKLSKDTVSMEFLRHCKLGYHVGRAINHLFNQLLDWSNPYIPRCSLITGQIFICLGDGMWFHRLTVGIKKHIILETDDSVFHILNLISLVRKHLAKLKVYSV